MEAGQEADADPGGDPELYQIESDQSQDSLQVVAAKFKGKKRQGEEENEEKEKQKEKEKGQEEGQKPEGQAKTQSGRSTAAIYIVILERIGRVGDVLGTTLHSSS